MSPLHLLPLGVVVSAVALLVGQPVPTPVQAGAIAGLDHIPVAVRHLDAAVATYRALGFTIKPGRPHANGLRNAHVKFPDGSGIELITADAAVDVLTRHYLEHLTRGDGPLYLALHARATDRLLEALTRGGYAFDRDGDVTSPTAPTLSFLFVVRDNRSATDRPEHFAHPNGATAMRSVWLAPDDPSAVQRFLTTLGGRAARVRVEAPDPAAATVVTLASGEVVILPSSAQLVPGRAVIGASFMVRDLGALRRRLEDGRIPIGSTARPDRILVAPDSAHGLWLEFRQD